MKGDVPCPNENEACSPDICTNSEEPRNASKRLGYKDSSAGTTRPLVRHDDVSRLYLEDVEKSDETGDSSS
jgi:hypothetical protein